MVGAALPKCGIGLGLGRAHRSVYRVFSISSWPHVTPRFLSTVILTEQELAKKTHPKCVKQRRTCTHDSTVEAVRPKSFVTLRHGTQAKKPTHWWHIFPLCFRWASGQISVYSTKDTRPNVSHATSASCLSENNESRRSFTLVFSAVHSWANCPRHISEIWSK